jgi:SSS family solute:Na+ symporter
LYLAVSNGSVSSLQPLDIAMLVAYFLAVAAIGWSAAKRSGKNTQEYFLSGRDVGWVAIGASLFAANISAEHFIGLAGSGFAGGLAVGHYEWLACFVLLLLGWLFVPYYLKNGVFTMPEFLERRYSPACRTYLSLVSLIAYVFTKISVALYAGASVFNVVLGWNMYVGAAVLIAATAAYTIVGGLRAVIYTELFQAFVLIGGAVWLTIVAVVKVGGLDALASGVSAENFNMWKPAGHPEVPWTGVIFGAPILGIWYWCTDQMIVQRTLAARNIREAQAGTIFAGFLKLLPVFILVLPGLAAVVLTRQQGLELAPDMVYPWLINTLLPAGVKGIVIAALLAALMSSLSAVYNSSSTLVVMDFYARLRPQSTERQRVRAGQLATVVLVVAGFLWVPFVTKVSNQLFQYLQAVQAYISPPIAAVFLLGLLSRRVNAAGALATLLLGFVFGSVRFVLEIMSKSESAPAWVTTGLVHSFLQVNFLNFAAILFGVSLLVHLVISLATLPPTPRELEIFQPKSSAEAAVMGRGGGMANVIASVILVACVLAGWLYFSPMFWK